MTPQKRSVQPAATLLYPSKLQEPRKTLQSEPFREARDQTNTSMFQRTT
jgi:hypothetical protein